MAISTATILAGANIFSADVTATLDADTTIVIPHGLGATPLLVTMSGMAASLEGILSAWGASAIGATNFTLSKTTAVGSGNAGIQIRVAVSLPHSITR